MFEVKTQILETFCENLISMKNVFKIYVLMPKYLPLDLYP